MPDKETKKNLPLDKIRKEAELRRKKIEKQLVETGLKPVSTDESSPLITDYDLHLFHAGTFYKVYEKFGAHIRDNGVQFTTWAPNAESISVIGEFNGWKEGVNEMERMNEGGVWTLFIPGLKKGDTYKYSIKSNVDGEHRRKSDPYAFCSELRPKNASVVADLSNYEWTDDEWVARRDGSADRLRERSVETIHELSLQRYGDKPLNIYEIHLGSWKKDYSKNEWGFMNYRELAQEIVKYAKNMGHTHIELMPVMEHPLDKSWGYQVTCYYAPTSRFGTPGDFMYFVDYCHQNNIGVILDWVPAHFPTDEHSLAYFDGRQIYAYESIKKGVHKDWGTFIFDYGKNEVQNFLIGSGLFWLDKYHADGLRVDAVASMLYLDYSREAGEWEPNVHGGHENLEAVNFLKHLNDIVHKYHPGTLMIAEESTAWPGVSHPVSEGGLGFDMKWNMGWMNDMLLYFSYDPIYRQYHQGKLTFSLWYAFSENFILPVSHDEVVYGKKSLLKKMPGDGWQKFANLRLFLGFMFAHPGKKLNFMTNDIAQYDEWNSEVGLEWPSVETIHEETIHEETIREETIRELSLQDEFNLYARDLFHLYKNHPAFFEVDFESAGFEWLDFSDSANSVIAFARYSKDRKEMLMFTFNMTPILRENYRFGIPKPGFYNEVLNSNASEYGGDGTGNMGGKHSEDVPHNDWKYSIQLTLPPLSIGVFKLEEKSL